MKICQGCKHYTSDHTGKTRCNLAGSHEPSKGYGVFDIPKCVHDDNLENLFEARAEGDVDKNASALRIKDEQLSILRYENTMLKRRLTYVELENNGD